MLKESSDTLNSGDAAPAFSLRTFDGNTVRFSDFRGRRLVVVFIRGTW